MKRLAVILLSLTLLVLLCACSSSESAVTGGTDSTPSSTAAAPAETPAPEEYPIHEQFFSEDGTLLSESVTDRLGSGGFIMTTTYYDPSGTVTGMLEDTLDEEKVLLSSRTLSPEGDLLSEWTSAALEDGYEEHITYFEGDRAMVTTDRYFDDLANETRSVTTTWFGLECERFASPTADQPDRIYSRWSLDPSGEEISRDYTCFETPGVKSAEISYTPEKDGSFTVLFVVYEAGGEEAAFSDKLSFAADGTLLAKQTGYPDGYSVDSTFADGFEIVSYEAEDGSRTDYRTDTQTGVLTSVLSCDSNGVPFLEKCYDENGLLTADLYYLDGAPHGKMLYSYDEAGRQVRSEKISPDGAAESVLLMFYDENGLLVRNEHYDGENNLIEYSSLTYAENGAVSSETIFSPNGRMKEKYEYLLDESGVRTGYRHYGADGNVLDEGSY